MKNHTPLSPNTAPYSCKSPEELIKEVAYLKKENTILKNIIDNIPANVFWKDINHRFMGSNKHHLPYMFVTSSEELIGKKTSDFLPADISAKVDAIDNEIIAKRKKIILEETGLSLGNRPAVFLSIKSPLYDDENDVIGTIGVALDITDRKKTEEELKIAKEKAEASSRIKSDFIANMNHDLKTPISGIIGLSEILMHRLNDENKPLAEKLFMSGRQLLAFIENCLELSKIETNNKLSKPVHFNAKSLLQEIHDLFNPSLGFKQLPLEIQYDDRLPEYLVGNRAGLYRILLNLISNAVKFTSKGYIKVGFSPTEPISDNPYIVEIKIKDTGAGITKEKLKRITFDCFTQITPSYKGTHEGSGLGLLIVQMYVEKMGGKIFLESAPGVGTEFTILLPFEKGTHQAESHHSTDSLPSLNSLSLSQIGRNPSPPRPDNTPSILLVEDNPIAQQIQYSIFTSLACHHIDIVDSGEKAIECFEPGKYDLIIMDIGLPQLQGNEASHQIRQKEKNSPFHVPIIALTAHASDEAIKEYINCGIDAVYSKPLSHLQATELLNNIKKK